MESDTFFFIILDPYHPSARSWPFLMQFYTIAAIYQKALIELDSSIEKPML